MMEWKSPRKSGHHGIVGEGPKGETPLCACFERSCVEDPVASTFEAVVHSP